MTVGLPGAGVPGIPTQPDPAAEAERRQELEAAERGLLEDV